MSRVILYIILGLLVLLIGCVGYLDYMSSSKPPTVAELLAAEKKAPQRPLVPVVVAAKPIAAGSLIAADALTIEQWPVRPADSRDNFEGLLGRRVRQDIAAGQPITSAQLTQGLSTYLKPGTRAVTLTLGMIANGSSPTVQPGDMVDLYVMQPGVDGGPVTASLLQSRVQVLAYAGQSLDGPDAGLAQSAVVAMPADKVDALLQAEGPGRIAVAVSRAEDETPAPAAAPAPAAPPQAQAVPAQSKPAAPTPPVAAQVQPAGTQAQSVAEQAQAVANQAQVVAKQAQTVAKQAQSVVESHMPPHAAAKPAAAKRAAHESRRERAHTRERSRAPTKPRQAASKPASAPTPAMTPPVSAPAQAAPAQAAPTAQPAVPASRSAAQGVEGIPLLRAPLTQSYNAPAAR
jgi:pilus assembly protein CpaB